MKREIERRREPGGMKVIEDRVGGRSVVGGGSGGGVGVGMFLDEDVGGEGEGRGTDGFGSSEESRK